MRPSLLLLALVWLISALEPARGDLTPWWNRRWRYRRTIEAKPPEKPYPGPDVAYIDFLALGAVQPDGQDVRVVARRRALPSKVLMVGPGDRCLVAFEMLPGVTTYHLYFGNPQADPPATDWEPRRGLLLEGWRWRGGRVDNLHQALQSIKSARPKQGAAFVSRINFGWNPFGPSENYVHIYTGWLLCPETGTYTFAVSAEHAAFLLIDGRPVVEWGGWHRPTWRANVRGQVHLVKGLHRLRFYHIEGRGRWNTAVVAWSLPSWNRTGRRNPRRLKFEVIPAEAFAPVVRARTLDLQDSTGRYLPDYLATNAGKAWLHGSHYLIRYRFAARLKRAQMLGARVLWDFGDGSTATGLSVEHIYLNPGTYTVTLTVSRANRPVRVSNRLVIEQDWNKQAQRRIDSLRRYAPSLRRRDPTRMTPRDLATAVDVFAKLRDEESVLRFGRVLLLGERKVEEGVLAEKALLLSRILVNRNRTEEALRMLAVLEERLADPRFRAQLSLRAGEILLERNDLVGAAARFSRIINRYGSVRDDAVRWALIRLADIHRRQGDRDRAHALYQRAASLKPIRPQFRQDLVRPGAPKPIRVSAYARTVEAFLLQKKLDDAQLMLDSWEWDYPEEKLAGHSSLLRVKLLIARGEYTKAAEEAETLASFDPRNPYAPEALLLAGQAYERLRRPRRAAEVYRRFLEEYPESPLVAQARKRLSTLTGGK